MAKSWVEEDRQDFQEERGTRGKNQRGRDLSQGKEADSDSRRHNISLHPLRSPGTACTPAHSTCGGLNKNGPHRLIYFGCLVIMEGHHLAGIRRCGLLRIDVALFSGSVSCRWWTLRFQKLKQGPVAHFLFLRPANPDAELSVTSPAPCLSAHLPCFPP